MSRRSSRLLFAVALAALAALVVPAAGHAGHGPDAGPPLRVNQHGYGIGQAKGATYATDAASPLRWELLNTSGTAVASGTTSVRGLDQAAGERVHTVDFSAYDTAGDNYRLRIGTDESYPFSIDNDVYAELRYDALAYYYHNRSGIPIESRFAGSAYARPAGHVDVAPNKGDGSVPCLAGSCDYRLDVTGGWYDAGDHGKYVVNGGISTWQLQNLYEQAQRRGTEAAFADGTMAIPENGNGVPDLLDESRWNLEFLLKMQVPDGRPLAGMAHHKIHDENWTGLPMLPHQDPENRRLSPPSVTATLNLAAAAAQGARLWRTHDSAFSSRALAAAVKAWDAAVANPDRLPDPNDGTGGGAYSDWRATDEFYWAAAELFITTGEDRYRQALTSSEWWYGSAFTAGGFSWQDTAALGDLALATVPNNLPASDISGIRQAIQSGADRYVTAQNGEGYPTPYVPTGYDYAWGSNSQVLNNAVVIATAYDLTGDQKYLAAASRTMDYLLGQNALNRSYVSGYGERHSRNQHHRHWANQADPSLPNPPPGSLAGGPNSSIQDPVAQQHLTGCAAQKCYIDDIGSWATNEVTINWNAPLAWMVSFLDDASGTTPPPPDDVEPPTVPPNLAAAGTTDTTVSLTWDASSDNVGVAGYDVYRETGSGPAKVGETASTSFTVTGLAPATAYTFHVRARDASGNVSPASNSVTATTGQEPPPPAGDCTVTYTVRSDWGSGFTADVTITNHGAPISGWTLGFGFPGSQRISNGWSATWSQSGSQVTARSLDWNANLATGGSATVGFNGTYSGSNPTPSDFTLNGAACTAG
ncbi:MAG: glycoside hydrolase family 9 protein [Micromonosporaceae bacterium]